MSLLARYVMKVALLSMLLGVAGSSLLQMIFAYLGELEHLSDSYKAVHVAYYIAYKMPDFWITFTPTGVLLGAVIGLGILANHSEIISMRAAGISLYRIVGWVMAPAFLFVILSLTMNEWVLPYTSEQVQNVKYTPSEKDSLSGYWTVIEKGNERSIVFIDYADSLGKAQGIKRFDLTDDEQGTHLVSALSAPFGVAHQEYVWQLYDVNHLDLDLHTQAKTTKYHTKQLVLPIAKESVHLLSTPAEDLAISDLYAHQKLMTHQGRVSKPHRLAFWQKLLSPFSVLSLLLIACSFVFGSLRSQSMGFKIVLALLTGLLFSYLQDLAGFVALVVDISPFVMVLLPIVLSAGLGVWLLNKKA